MKDVEVFNKDEIERAIVDPSLYFQRRQRERMQQNNSHRNNRTPPIFMGRQNNHTRSEPQRTNTESRGQETGGKLRLNSLENKIRDSLDNTGGMHTGDTELKREYRVYTSMMRSIVETLREITQLDVEEHNVLKIFDRKTKSSIRRELVLLEIVVNDIYLGNKIKDVNGESIDSLSNFRVRDDRVLNGIIEVIVRLIRLNAGNTLKIERGFVINEGESCVEYSDFDDEYLESIGETDILMLVKVLHLAYVDLLDVVQQMLLRNRGIGN